MSNIIDSIRLSGVTYTLSAQTGGGGVPESTFSAYTAATDSRLSEDEEVTAAGLNALNESLSGKQDTLIAGDNITISGNVISASGGGSITIDSGITSGSTNAVENGAIWSATTYNKEVTLEFDNSSWHYSTNFPSGCTTVKVTVPNGTGYITVNFYSGSTNYQVGSVNIQKYGSTPSVSLSFTDASYTIENNDVIITYPASKSVDKVGVNIGGLEGAIVKAVVEGAWVNENTYMSVEVDGKIKALDDKKLDATAYTPTVVDSQLNAASTNPVQNQALYDELVIEGAETETTLTFSADTTYSIYKSTNYPNGCTKVKVVYPTNSSGVIFFNNGNNQLGYATINNYGTPIVSLTFNGASYSIVDGVVVITYPTVANVDNIRYSMYGTAPDSVEAVTTQTTHLIDQVTANTASIATKQDILSAGTGIDITDNVISVTGGSGGGISSAECQTMIDNSISGKQDTLVSGTNIKTINNESLLGSGNIDIQGGGSSYTAGDGIDITNDVISVTGKVSTSDFNTYSGSVESRLSEDEEVTAAGLNALNDKFGGLKLVKLTQTEYDNLSTKDSNTLYVIVN